MEGLVRDANGVQVAVPPVHGEGGIRRIIDHLACFRVHHKRAAVREEDRCHVHDHPWSRPGLPLVQRSHDPQAGLGDRLVGLLAPQLVKVHQRAVGQDQHLAELNVIVGLGWDQDAGGLPSNPTVGGPREN